MAGYDDYFPDSPRRRMFGHSSGKTTLIKALLLDYKMRSNESLRPSTWTGYRKAIDNVRIPEFGDIQVGALGVAMLRDWISKQRVTRKRMSNLLLPLRNALTEAVADEVIEFKLWAASSSRASCRETRSKRTMSPPRTNQANC
jgi:integrase